MAVGGTASTFSCGRGILPQNIDHFGQQRHAMSCHDNLQTAKVALAALKELESTGAINVPSSGADMARQFFLVHPDGRGAMGEPYPAMASEENA